MYRSPLLSRGLFVSLPDESSGLSLIDIIYNLIIMNHELNNQIIMNQEVLVRLEFTLAVGDWVIST